MDFVIPPQVQTALERIATPWGTLVGLRADHITRTIQAEGQYEWAETAIVGQVLRAGSVAIDVGANIGYYTALLQLLVGARGAVHAFEANPLTAALLRLTLKENGWPQVTVNNVALGDTASTIPVKAMDMAEVAQGDSLNLGAWALRSNKAGTWKIDVTTLDRYVRDRKLEKVHFVKVDVEDFELKVMQGADMVMRKLKPNVMIETRVNDDADRVRFDRMLEFLQHRDFACCRIVKRPFPHFRSLGAIDLAGPRFHFNLLAMPGARYRDYENSLGGRA